MSITIDTIQFLHWWVQWWVRLLLCTLVWVGNIWIDFLMRNPSSSHESRLAIAKLSDNQDSKHQSHRRSFMHLHFTSKASAIIRSSETLHCFHVKHKRLPICPRNSNLHSHSNLNSILNLTGSYTRTAITRQRFVSSNSVLNYLKFSTNLNSKSDIPTKSTSLNLNLSSPDLSSRTTQLNSKALRDPHYHTRTFNTRARAGASLAMAKAGKMTDGELVEAALKRLWDDDNSINASQSTIDIGINLADPSYDKVQLVCYGYLWRHWESPICSRLSVIPFKTINSVWLKLVIWLYP